MSLKEEVLRNRILLNCCRRICYECMSWAY